MTTAKLSRGRKRLLASVCVLASVALFVDFHGFFAFTMPNARTMRRMLSTRFLSRPLPDGGCEWLPPAKLDSANANAPRTILVAYPGSGKRLAWRMLEAMTGFRSGDDWDLSEEGKDVLIMKTQYPHPEGVWTWGGQFYDASIVLLIRNPRWAIPSYQTMRHELDYSNSWDKSFVRRPYTYTERGQLDDWEAWRASQFQREIDLWGWYIDFWMNDGLRRNDGFGNPTQDYHCKPSTNHIKTCKPKVVIDFDFLYGNKTGEAETQKLMAAVESNVNPNGVSIPMISQENRKCVFEQTVAKRLTEERWDNSNRDGYGVRQYDKNFTHDELGTIKNEILRLIGTYTNSTLGWDEDPVAKDLVVHLYRYLGEVKREMCSLSCERTAIFDNSNFRSAVMGYLYDTDTTIQEFGPINCWDVSGVTDMAGLFARERFNEDIGCWDTSNVVTMKSMFHGVNFNQDITAWDVSSVTDFTDTFRASLFNQDIRSWDVSNVTSFYRTFLSSKFNHDLTHWDVSSALEVRQMFYRAGAFNQDMCAWASKMNPGAMMNYMFVESGCEYNVGDPSLTTDPPGPFCFACT